MRTETLYHGSHRNTHGLVVHTGLCLTLDDSAAVHYAGRDGATYEVEIDLSGLTVREVPGYDHDTNDCPADHDDFCERMAAEGADVLRYEDEDERGRRHECYRLISDRALAAIITSTTYDA